MEIRVTQSDIDNGIKCDSKYCPIALALKRNGFLAVYVGSEVVQINGENWELPRRAKNFINDFDTDEPVSPFELILED